MSASTIISCRDLEIGYGSRVVGSGLSIAVDGGEIVCLLGPNGCGKTTLFRTMLGLLPALAGRIEVAGRPLSSLSRKEIARTLAFVPQAHAPGFPYDTLTVVTMGRTAHMGSFSHPSAKDREIAMHALERLGIADLAHRDYSRLSGGQRQLVLIARALAQQAAMIIMDEPTASLDFANQARVLGEIARLVSGESTQAPAILLSTHDPDQAFALEARAVLMSQGRIAADGPAAGTLTGDRLSEVYGVAVAVEITPAGHTVCIPALGGERRDVS